MKILLQYLTCLRLFLSIMLLVPVVASANLLNNGDLATFSANGVAAGWVSNQWGGQVTYSQHAQGVNDSSSQKMAVGANKNLTLKQEFDLTPGVLYRLSAYVRADSDAEIGIYVQNAHSPWTNLAFERPALEAGAAWKHVEFTFVGRDNERMRVSFNPHNTNTNYYIDNVVLEAATLQPPSAGENLITNGELNTFSSNGIATGWVSNEWGGEVTYSQHVQGVNDSSSQKVAVGDNKDLTLKQEFDLIPGMLYRLSAFVRADSEAELGIHVQNAHSPWTSLASERVGLQAGANWKRIVFTFIGRDNERMRLSFTPHNINTNYYIDSVVLEPIDNQLLANPGFDDVRFGTQSPWRMHSWGGTGVNESQAASDCGINLPTTCQRIRAFTDQGKIVFRQNVHLQQHHVYKAGVWLRTDTEYGIDQTLQARVALRSNNESQHFAFYGSTNQIVTPEWKRYEFLVVAFDPDVSSVRFELQASEVNKWLYIDGAELVDLTDEYSTKLGSNTELVSHDSFGVHFNKGNYIYNWMAAGQQDVNFGLLRLWDSGVQWKTLYPDYDFETRLGNHYLSKFSQYMAPSGAKLLYTFGYIPSSLSPTQKFGEPPAEETPEWAAFKREWATYVDGLVVYAGNYIDYYELWNEASYKGFWAGTPEQLVELAEIAYEIIRDKDPSAQILLPNITRLGLNFLDRYLAAGGGAYADAASYHMYYPYDGNYAFDDDLALFYFAVQDVLLRHGLEDMDIHMTEGAPIVRTVLTTSESQALATRFFLSHLIRGAKTTSYYHWENHPGVNEHLPLSTGDESDQFGTLDDAGIAVRELKNWMVGYSVTSWERDNGINVVVLSQGGQIKNRILFAVGEPVSNYSVATSWNVHTIKYLDASSHNYMGNSIDVGIEPLLLVSD
jgi:hypothetical protein